ncbi:GH3 auxin-responsive promoter family protein [Alienimonas californiensis]|uniref:GH3 auxin-responsive promoter n=1 Tax=Alienimonas californiensis TaxID=2527989 RepID=A0A517PFI4_9PLAN|nr:GH3 auxin-responsive promoter family protein [Alienimonas californiensis]QDT18132.1 GH3 auxin-responsive promoter [Alienimonas californiensis]
MPVEPPPPALRPFVPTNEANTVRDETPPASAPPLRPRRHVVGERFTLGQRIVERVLFKRSASVTADLHAAGRDVRGTQLELLGSLIRRARRSDFGRDRDLASIRERDRKLLVRELRSRVPVMNYADHRPYIEATLAGRARALFRPGERIAMFALTSGTTDARKFLPVPRRAVQNHRRGWFVWGLSTFLPDPPALLRGKLALAGDPAEEHSPGGTPCGSISGLLAQLQPGTMKRTYVAPPEAGFLRREASPAGAAARLTEAKYYLQWRFGVHCDVSSFVTPNPASHLNFARWGAAHAELLIDHTARGGLPEDLFAPGGALAGVDLPGSVRRAARRHLPADPARAQALRAIARNAGGLRPADVWANLNIIGCWTGGTLGHYLPLLREFYGDARIRDIGLIASEGRTTIPMQDGTPAGLLDVRGAFFEFVPEERIDQPDPPVLLADELTPGRNYYVLMTTPGGLWRYDIRDVVRCEGYAPPTGSARELKRSAGPGTPSLSFLSKGRNFSSVTGEKLTEYQAAAAVSGALESLGRRLNAYALAPVFHAGSPRYELFAAAGEAPPPAVAAEIDRRLRSLNCEYDAKRASGRLGALAVRPLPAGAWEAWDARRLALTGGVAEQYKRPVLIGDLAFADDIDPPARRSIAG